MDHQTSARRYEVTLAHRCGLGTADAREVAATSITELLRTLHDPDHMLTACPACGPEGMTVSSIVVVVEEYALTERLGPFAEELFVTV